MRAVSDPEAQVTARSAELVGHYGLRMVWNDGHDTGIYDYALLRRLGDKSARDRGPV
jgi:DUF971 family protein